MWTKIRWIAICVMLVSWAPLASPATDVTAVLQKMRAAQTPGRDMRAKVEFVIENADEVTIRWSGSLERLSRPALQRIVLDRPADLAGITVMVRGTPAEVHGVEIYLPFVRRVREIGRDMRGVSFLGTDFNFEDLGFVELDYHQHSIVGDEEIDGRRCHRIDSVPERGWWYGRISRCVDAEDFIPRRTDYFAPGGDLFKTRTVHVETVAGHATPTRIEMQVVPAKTKTIMILTDVEYDVGLEASGFTIPE
jgi:hypothetical protein